MDSISSLGVFTPTNQTRMAPVFDLAVARRKRRWNDGSIALMVASLFIFVGVTVTLIVHPLVTTAMGAPPNSWFGP